MADLKAPRLHDSEEVKGGLDEHGPGLQITLHEIHKGLLHTLQPSEAVQTQDVMSCPIEVQDDMVGLTVVDPVFSVAVDTRTQEHLIL